MNKPEISGCSHSDPLPTDYIGRSNRAAELLAAGWSQLKCQRCKLWAIWASPPPGAHKKASEAADTWDEVSHGGTISASEHEAFVSGFRTGVMSRSDNLRESDG